MKPIASLLVALIIPVFIFAQAADDDNNIVIKKSTREFAFEKGDKENPVKITEESRRLYYCNNFRADIGIAEFYNGVETIDDVDIYVDDSKAKNIKPIYEYYNSDGIFYSDAHICYFTLPLVKKGSTSEVTFKKTTLDPRYFTSINLMEPQQVQQQEIKIIVPSWMELEIKEFNFAKYNVQRSVTEKGGDKIYTYTASNLPTIKSEKNSPGYTYYAPHLLVLCKSAQPKDETHTYFKTLKEQYNWYKNLVAQIGNDEKTVKDKALEITKGITTEEDKVKTIFQWVQDNVRYIAFEDGIAGFKPEKAQEVMRKKYGDCKGMANLLTEMLKGIGLDARRCWIGTKHIAYDYSTPSLSVDNHMICAWMNKGKPVFLDGTEKYIGFGEVAERIQGRQVLIENANDYQLEKVPVKTNLQNVETESRKLSIDGNDLKGHIVQNWKGESKQWLLSGINGIKIDKQETALKNYLSEGKSNFEVSNLKIINIDNYNADLKVEYDIVWKGALTTFDKETYLDIDNRRNFDGFKIDATKRKLPYWLNYKNHAVIETELALPADKAISALPEKLTVKRPGYSFTAGYTQSGNKLLYSCETVINDTEIKTENFAQWNEDIEKLNNFYNQQITLTQK